MREHERPFLDAQDLLDRLGTPRAGLDRRVVGHQRDRPAIDRADARHHPVGAEPLLPPVGQQRLLGERAVVQQQRDALAHGQLALLERLLAVALGTASQRAGGRLVQIGQPVALYPRVLDRRLARVVVEAHPRLAPEPAGARASCAASAGARSGARGTRRTARRRSSRACPGRRSPRAASGPIGYPAPAFIASSISPTEPTPSSYARIASSKYGTSRRLTMKPALSLVGIASLPSERANSKRGLERLIGRGHAADHLDQLHHLGGVEVVQAHEPLRATADGGLVDHGQRGGVRREHRLRLDDLVELLPHLELHLRGSR